MHSDCVCVCVTISCLQINVVEATGLPKEYSHYVFCQYQFWHEDEPMIIPPLIPAALDKLSDKVQRFDHKQVCVYVCTDLEQ